MRPILFTLFLTCSLLSTAQINKDLLVVEYVNWNNSTYAFIRNVKPNMIQAREACKSLAMDLVKIESEAENLFVTDRAFSKTGIKTTDGNQYWIGASDDKKEGDWNWVVDNTEFFDEKKKQVKNQAYNHWGKTTLGSQPNNVMKNDEDEDCAVIRPGGDWYDIGCTRRFAYIICESKLKE